MLSLLSPESVRRPRRCSICGDTRHDRRFHSVNERIQQTNRINETRVNRVIPTPSEYTITPQPHTETIMETIMETITETITETGATPVNYNANNVILRRMTNFKLVLERIARRETRMVDLIRNIRIFGAVDCIVQFAIEMGAPPNRTFNAYFYRVVSLVFVMFNDLHVHSIDEIIIGQYYMTQPDQWFYNYCNSVARNQRELLPNHSLTLKQKRLDKLLYNKPYTHDTYNSSEFECPLCYENIPKLNSIETPCNHHFCKNCFSQFVLHSDVHVSLNCPLCRNALFHSFLLI